jgi:hypothetical protein
MQQNLFFFFNFSLLIYIRARDFLYMYKKNILLFQVYFITFFIIATKKVTKIKSRQTRSLRAFCLASTTYRLPDNKDNSPESIRDGQLLQLSYFVCNPHSFLLLSSHHQRPARKSSPSRMARVQGAQPMLTNPLSCNTLYGTWLSRIKSFN